MNRLEKKTRKGKIAMLPSFVIRRADKRVKQQAKVHESIELKSEKGYSLADIFNHRILGIKY